MPETFDASPPPPEIRQEDITPLPVGTHTINGHRVTVSYADDWPEVEKLAQTLSGASVPTQVRSYLESIVNSFLRLPLVQDDFDVDKEGGAVDPELAHVARRAWEHELGALQKMRLDLNMLAGGHVSGLLPLFSALSAMAQQPLVAKLYEKKDGSIPVDVFRELDEEAQALQSNYDQRYQTLPVEQKIAFMYEARAFMRRAVERVIEAYQE